MKYKCEDCKNQDSEKCNYCGCYLVKDFNSNIPYNYQPKTQHMKIKMLKDRIEELEVAAYDKDKRIMELEQTIKSLAKMI